MGRTVIVGTWHEREARDITHCPSYYAADSETLRTVPGEYPVRLTFEGGYLVPMPYWLLIGINTTRVDGRLYSGFGGLNVSSTELPKGEAVRHTIQTYAYNVANLVARGDLTLAPGFEWLLEERAQWEAAGAPKTWDDVGALEGETGRS